MKRSDALKALRSIICAETYCDLLLSNEEANNILAKLEQLGLTPPEYLPEPEYCEVTGKQLECKPIRKWEAE